MPVTVGPGWRIGGGWSMGSGGAAPPPPPAVTDPYFMYNSLLLTGDGTNLAQNNTFLDSSTNNFAVTRAGNTTQGSFSPYGANWSNYLGGVGNYFQTPASSASTIVGTLSNTANLTIECWIYPTAYNSSANFPGLIGDMNATFENNNWSWGITNTGTLMVYWNVSGTQLRATTSNAVSLNTWTHIALNVAAGAITMYINGVAQNLSGTTTLSTPSTSNGYLVIGQWNNGSGGTGGTSHGLYTGYISNLRVVKASTYTSGFTPSTVPLTAIANTSLLYCQSNRFKDNSSNAFALTVSGTPTVQVFSPFEPSAAYSPSTIGGSVYFDGNSSYLSPAQNVALRPETSDFTIEAWIYRTGATTGNAGNTNIFGTSWSGGSPSGAYLFFLDSNYKINFAVWNTNYGTSTTTINIGQWYHVAFSRSGTTNRLFVNGVLESTTSGQANANNSAYSIYVGRYEDPNGYNGYLTAYLSDVRFVKGTAVYTSTFTPPTAPLTAVANTQLLLSMTNGGITDSAMINDLQTVGDAKISTAQSKFGGSSMLFDGTGDYLNIPGNAIFNVSSGDFTIEYWKYHVNNSAYQTDFYIGNGGTISLAVGIDNTLHPYIQGSSGQVNSSVTITAATWNHIAWVKSGSTITGYLNGVSMGSSFAVNIGSNTTTVIIGYFPGYGQYTNGYIDDLRVTKGYARYTTNFTPPTAALPTY